MSKNESLGFYERKSPSKEREKNPRKSECSTLGTPGDAVAIAANKLISSHQKGFLSLQSPQANH